MFHFSSRARVIAATIGLIAVGIVVSYLLAQSDAIPKDFVDARLQGAAISQSIVDLANQSASDVSKISELDQQGKFAEATDVAVKAIQESQNIREQAVRLSDEVSKMTQALSSIKSFEARQAALEAIANRLALISRLINYSDYLNQLLTTLQARFQGQAKKNRNVATIIAQINAEVTAINSFNDQATQDMARFDQITGR